MLRSTPMPTPVAGRRNLLEIPLIGNFLRWKYARQTMQAVMLVVAGLLLFDGLLGPQVAYQNLATVSAWVHYRGFLMLALLVFGNFFCMACPFMLPRKGAKWLQAKLGWGRGWPSQIPQKSIAIVLLVLFFWSYETYNLWASPWLTAWVAIGYFLAAFITDLFFKGAAFCKYVCPVGQFNMLYSTIAPTEIAVIQTDICATCTTKDCIAGRENIPGCETHLFQPRKVGNLDCTYCLDCVHACPYENVGILTRIPGAELISDARRSGIGTLSDRLDIAFLIMVLTFGAFMQAFGMIPPIYELEAWLAARMGVSTEAPVLAVIFFVGVVLLPTLLVTAAAWLSRAGGKVQSTLKQSISRFAPSLVPVGAGMWAAHYSFHFFIGALTLIPVSQNFVADVAGSPIWGQPRWELSELMNVNQILFVQMGFLYAGLIGSLLVAWLIALQTYRTRQRAFWGWLPWAVLLLVLMGTGFWIFLNPMEMRGTINFQVQ